MSFVPQLIGHCYSQAQSKENNVYYVYIFIFKFYTDDEQKKSQATSRQTREEFRASGRPRCRARRLPRNRCRRPNRYVINDEDMLQKMIYS